MYLRRGEERLVKVLSRRECFSGIEREFFKYFRVKGIWFVDISCGKILKDL